MDGAKKGPAAVDGSDDFTLCPICRELLGTDVYMIGCGHNFCYDCLLPALSVKEECPVCGLAADTKDMKPNVAMSKMNFRANGDVQEPPMKRIRGYINGASLSLNEIELITAELNEKRDKMARTEWDLDIKSTEYFLQDRLAHKELAVKNGVKEMRMIKVDLERLRDERAAVPSLPSADSPLMDQEYESKAGLLAVADGLAETAGDTGLKRRLSSDGPITRNVKRATRSKDSSSAPAASPMGYNAALPRRVVREELSSRPGTPSLPLWARAPSPDWERAPAYGFTIPPRPDDGVDKRKKVMGMHIDDLERAYFDSRVRCRTDAEAEDGLNKFRRTLMAATRYSRLAERARLTFADINNTSAIVSSIEFDKDQEYFATAGVTKKIKIFNYNTIMEQPNVDSHPSEREMVSISKISCLSWNPYIKYHIASSDYDGVVCLWDVNTGQNMQRFTEHEKRAWSVDFSPVDPSLLASGSDDAKVKIWSVRNHRGKAVHTIDSKANICCVRFNPTKRNYIAFGSADHHIHYYDMRQLSVPVHQFKGHDKAVSYVKFLNGSTDSTLKLWDVDAQENTKTFTGHKNEKNFVGLTTNGEYIACGSENNSVFCYHKDLSKQLINYSFGTMSAATGQEKEDEDSTQHFVSSVCWKPKSSTLLAANSQGTIKVLEAV